MATYNGGELLRRSINSILEQNYKNYELIIVDDCSNSKTQSILSEYLHFNKIKVIRNSTNHGLAKY